jgi:predicted RNase H-like HicB family nuclease
MADWPEVLTQGDDWDEAMEQARDAFGVALAWRIEHGEVFPKATPVSREKDATDELIWLSIG